jgi:hypothetical protein
VQEGARAWTFGGRLHSRKATRGRSSTWPGGAGRGERDLGGAGRTGAMKGAVRARGRGRVGENTDVAARGQGSRGRRRRSTRARSALALECGRAWTHAGRPGGELKVESLPRRAAAEAETLGAARTRSEGAAERRSWTRAGRASCKTMAETRARKPSSAGACRAFGAPSPWPGCAMPRA